MLAMLRATVKRTIKKNPELLNKVNREFMPQAVIKLEQTAKDMAQIDKGQLKGSFSHKVQGNTGIVANNAEHAIYVEYGTRPHTITVNGPVFLKSKKSGTIGWRYLGTIRHPGTKAQPFMRPAARKEKKPLVDLWRSIFRRVYGG
jgi:HK97 gp10 family phage protein